MNAAEWAALRGVADRFRGQPLGLAPVAQELVLAILTTSLAPQLLETFVSLPEMAAEIAATIWDDPSARSRLESLWNRLSGDPQAS